MASDHLIRPVSLSRATSAKASGFRWFVLFLIFLTYMVAGADRANLGVAVPYIKADFHLTNTDIGAAASIFFIGYTLIQIPAGLIFQRLGVRGIMSGAMLLTSLSTLLIGFTGSALQLKLARGALGAAEGPINVGILTTINRWFPPSERGTAVGVFMASIKFAPAVVPPLAAAIIYAFGWREVFYFFAAPGLLVAVLWMVFINDDPKTSRFTNAAEADYIDQRATVETRAKDQAASRAWPKLDRLIRARRVAPLVTNMQVVRSWSIWGCALGYGFMAGLTYAIMTWVPTYLVEAKHYSLFQMGFVASAPWIGACIGAVAGGLISDRIFGGRRKPVMLITAASTILTMYGLVNAPDNPAALALALVATGILLNIGYSTFLAYPMGMVAKPTVPFASALVNTLGAAGSAVAPFAVGVILDRFDWNVAFLFLSACSLGALLVVLLIVEPLPAES